jgi:hypothetical protein
MPGLSRLPMSVVVDITDELMTLTTGDRKLGTWNLSKIEFVPGSDGFHIVLDDEEVVLGVVESDQFAAELGRKRVAKRPRVSAPAPVPSVVDLNGGTSNAVTRRLAEIGPDEQSRDVEKRIAALERDLESDSVAPEEVFRRWLRLLKEINLKHGQDAMPTSVYYRLNSRLLDVMPEPKGPGRAG